MTRPSSARSRRPAPATTIFAGALVGTLLATLLVLTPAQALVAVPVDCGTDKVVLEVDHLSYDLEGTCGVVVVDADDTTVSLPSAVRLVVLGDRNSVVAGPLTRVVVKGQDNRVSTPSVRSLRLASPGSVVAVEGLVEKAVLARRRGTVRADRVTELRVSGRHHRVRGGRGYDALVEGHANQLAYRRLEELVVVGNRNEVRVRRGATAVRIHGSDNRIRVHRRV